MSSSVKAFIRRLLIASILLVVAWVGFLALVNLPTDSNAALVMVWLSILVILFAAFPDLLNRIKRIKLGDLLDIELREAIAGSRIEDYITLLEVDSGILGEKATFNGCADCCKRQQFNQRSLFCSLSILGMTTTFPRRCFSPTHSCLNEWHVR